MKSDESDRPHSPLELRVLDVVRDTYARGDVPMVGGVARELGVPLFNVSVAVTGMQRRGTLAIGRRVA